MIECFQEMEIKLTDKVCKFLLNSFSTNFIINNDDSDSIMKEGSQ